MTQRTAANHPIAPTTTTGTELAALIDDDQEANESGHSGTARPSYMTNAGVWVKIDTDTNIMYFDGTNDHILFTIDVSESTQPYLTCGGAVIQSSTPSAFRGRLWLDTTTTPPILKVYNGSSWEEFGVAQTTFPTVVQKNIATAAYTLLAADAGGEINLSYASGTITVTLPADAGVPVGYYLALFNRTDGATVSTVNVVQAATGQKINQVDTAVTISDCIKSHGAAYLKKVATNDWELVY